MYALISLFVVASLSLLVIRIGTVALAMTGLSEEIASFQSLSAFSGAGFTTEEAERAHERMLEVERELDPEIDSAAT